MPNKLLFTARAKKDLERLEGPNNLVQRKAVKKALLLMESDLRHPGLRVHKYSSFPGHEDVQVFESYAQNKTPGAYRIFWRYGPGKGEITILAILPHP